VAGISRVKAARREFRRAIRKAKRDCWNRFLQEADGKKVWTAAAYTTPRIDKTGQVVVREDGTVAEGHREREQAVLQAHFPQGPPGSFESAAGGQAFERVDTELVGSLLKAAANTSAPGDDRISAGIVKVFWQWDQQRVTQLVWACIRLGFHLGIWKTAIGVVIPKPGEPDYSKVRAYRVISLLDVISKLLEHTAAHLIADHLERKRGLHEGQFGCRKRRSCVDAVAILMNRTQQAWERKKIGGALFMDFKSAFNNVDKTFLGTQMEQLGLEADLICWTMTFMSDRQVKLVLDGEVGEENPVDTGVPQGSPAAPILFITYLSGVFDEVERAAPDVSGLSFVDDIGWWVEGKNAEEVANKLSLVAAAAIEWAGKNGMAFDHGKTEAAIFWRKNRKGTRTEAKVRVGDKEVSFNRAATRWLGVWLDSQLTLKEHHATRLKSGQNTMNRLKRLMGQMGLSPINYRRVMSACVQSVTMFGAELWRKGGNIRGMTGHAEELQHLTNREARATTGAFRTTNLGALLMESGLRPATNQLENRQRRFGLRLLSLPQGAIAREAVGASTAIGKRLSTALDRTWIETERTVLLEEPESFAAELIQEEWVEAKREAEKERPGLVMFTDGSWLENESARYAVAWKNGQTWEGIKIHMGFNQDAYDAECAALAHALKTAAEIAPTPSNITIFTNVQAAIWRMLTDEPGPGQKHALKARQHIAALRRAVPDITIEIRWCLAHQGVEGNEKDDEV